MFSEVRSLYIVSVRTNTFYTGLTGQKHGSSNTHNVGSVQFKAKCCSCQNTEQMVQQFQWKEKRNLITS